MSTARPNPKPAKTDSEKTNELSRERDQSFRWISGLHISEVAKLRSKTSALEVETLAEAPKGEVLQLYRSGRKAGPKWSSDPQFRSSGVNVNSPQAEEARRRIQPAYHGYLQSCSTSIQTLYLSSRWLKRAPRIVYVLTEIDNSFEERHAQQRNLRLQ